MTPPTQTKKSIVVFDNTTRVIGHRLPYASLVASSFEKSSVTLALPEQLRDNPVLDEYFPGMKRWHFECPESGPGLGNAKSAATAIQRIVEELRPDVIAIPTGDGIAPYLGLRYRLGLANWLKNVRTFVCLMVGARPPSQVRGGKKLMNWLKWQCIRTGPFEKILLADPRLFDELESEERVVLCPDPVPHPPELSKLEARKSLGLPESGSLMISVGEQNLRKGSDLLVKAFQAAKLQNNDRLFLMGKLSKDVLNCLGAIEDNKTADGKILVWNRFVTEAEFQLGIIASDIVAVPYRDTDRPSGIVSRCIGWNRPVLGTNHGWTDWIIRKLEIGHAVNIDSLPEFAQGIEFAMKELQNYRTPDIAQSFRDFNTEENYRNLWKNVIE